MSNSKSKQEEPDRRDHFQKPKRPWMAIGIILSLLTSCTLLIWAFTLPLRRLSSSTKPVATQQNPLEIARQKRSEAQEIREVAIVDHRNFLHSLEKENERKFKQDLPGKKNLQQRWTRSSEKMQREISELTRVIEEHEAPKGSILWENREQLMKIVADSVN